MHKIFEEKCHAILGVFCTQTLFESRTKKYYFTKCTGAPLIQYFGVRRNISLGMKIHMRLFELISNTVG